MNETNLDALRRAARPRSARRPWRATVAAVGALALLAACGGSSNGGGSGGGTGGGTGGTPSVNGTISGTATKGLVVGGTMTAFAVTGGMKGAQLATAKTDVQGRFTMSMGDYSGPVMLELTGGTYADEATGSPMQMLAGDVMTAVLPSFAAGSTASGVQVTPVTSMAQARAQAMQGGMTEANVTAANQAMGSYFSVGDILHMEPMHPAVPQSGTGATQDAKNYGMTIAAMSQEAQVMGMTLSSSSMVTAMMHDASDGTMNGMMGSTAISMAAMPGMGGSMMRGDMPANGGTSGLADAMEQFLASDLNRSGVTAADMAALMERLRASNGALQP